MACPPRRACLATPSHHWVGTGRVTLRHVSPCPPLDPYVRLSPHTAHDRGILWARSISPAPRCIPHGQLCAFAGYLCTVARHSPSGPSPCTRLSRVHNRGLKQDGLGGVLLSVPSALCGSPVLCRVNQVDLHQPFVRATDATHRPLLSIDFGGLADIAGKVCQGLGFPKDYARFL